MSICRILKWNDCTHWHSFSHDFIHLHPHTHTLRSIKGCVCAHMGSIWLGQYLQCAGWRTRVSSSQVPTTSLEFLLVVMTNQFLHLLYLFYVSKLSVVMGWSLASVLLTSTSMSLLPVFPCWEFLFVYNLFPWWANRRKAGICYKLATLLLSSCC